jgi:hypothetical protein
MRDKIGVTNMSVEQRGARLQSTFLMADVEVVAGIPVDEEVFSDYLAIKYLRNSIVHGRWHEHEKEWLHQRGFPTDARRLSTKHLHKIDHVTQNMMFYIFLTGVGGPRSREAAIPPPTKPEKLLRLDETATLRADDRGILKIRDLDRIIWNNLERINSLLWHSIEKTVSTAPYEWPASERWKKFRSWGTQIASDSFSWRLGALEKIITNPLLGTVTLLARPSPFGENIGGEPSIPLRCESKTSSRRLRSCCVHQTAQRQHMRCCWEGSRTTLFRISCRSRC